MIIIRSGPKVYLPFITPTFRKLWLHNSFTNRDFKFLILPQIEYKDIERLAEQRGVSLAQTVRGYEHRNISDIKEFVSALVETMMTHAQRVTAKVSIGEIVGCLHADFKSSSTCFFFLHCAFLTHVSRSQMSGVPKVSGDVTGHFGTQAGGG